MKRGALLCGLLSLVAGGRLAAAQANPGPSKPGQAELIEYTIQSGDTCIGIALRFYGHAEACARIYESNPHMGPRPDTLVPGQIIKVPRQQPRRPDARLTDRRGAVAVKEPTARLWAQAQRGMDLFRAWRVWAKERAWAEVTFDDKSVMSMRENTVVIIYGPADKSARRQTREAALERGTLRTRLAEIDGPPLLVTTTSSASEVKRSDVLVKVDRTGRSLVANHKGAPVRVSGRRAGKRSNRGAVAVKRGMGSEIKPGQSPSPPTPLPAVPRWTSGPRRFVGTGSAGGTLRGAWQPVAKADQYWIEITADSGAVLAQVAVSARTTSFAFAGLPPGAYAATVAAIDQRGFEGPPSARAVMHIAALDIRPPGQGPKRAAALGTAAETAAPAPDPTTGDAPIDVTRPPGPTVVMQGSTIIAPAGMRCAALERVAPTRQVVLAHSGTHVLRCQDDLGQPLAPFALQVKAIPVQVRTAAQSDRPLLHRGQKTLVRIEVGDGVEVTTLRVVAAADAEVGDPVRESPRVLAVPVTVIASAGDKIALRLVTDTGTDSVTLAEIPLAVAPPGQGHRDPAVAPPGQGHRNPTAWARAGRPGATAPVSERRWELGMFGGTGTARRSTALESNASNLRADSEAALVGVRMGVGLHTHAFVEAEVTAGAIARPDRLYLGTDTVSVYTQLRTPFWSRDRLGLFAGFGLGARALVEGSGAPEPSTSSRLVPLIGYGFGAKLALIDAISLRFDVRHLLAIAQNVSSTSLLEASLGVSLSWGAAVPR